MKELETWTRSTVETSDLSAGIKALLSDALSKHLNALETMCKSPPTEMTNLANHCGLSITPSEMNGKIPKAKPLKYALLNICIVDALLDACRSDSDVKRVKPPTDPAHAPLVNNNVQPPHGLKTTRSILSAMEHFLSQLRKTGDSLKKKEAPGSLSEIEGDGSILMNLYTESQKHLNMADCHKLVGHTLELALLINAWCTVSNSTVGR